MESFSPTKCFVLLKSMWNIIAGIKDSFHMWPWWCYFCILKRIVWKLKLESLFALESTRGPKGVSLSWLTKKNGGRSSHHYWPISLSLLLLSCRHCAPHYRKDNTEKRNGYGVKKVWVVSLLCCSCSPPAAEYTLGLPVLTACFPVRAKGILEKGGLSVELPLEDCFIGLAGSSTWAGTGCTDLQLIGSSVADFQALTWHS